MPGRRRKENLARWNVRLDADGADVRTYLRSELPVVGFAVIEAKSVEEAVRRCRKRRAPLLTESSKCGHSRARQADTRVVTTRWPSSAAY